jgi:hypothetical protein
MALFGSIGKVFHEVIHNPVVQVVFPAVAVGNLLAEAGLTKVVGAVTPHAPVPAQIQAGDHSTPYAVQQPFQGNAPQPYAQSYQSYGGFQDPGYNPYAQGAPSWGYSTPSPVYLTPQYPTFSAPPVDRTWETLAEGAALFL